MKEGPIGEWLTLCKASEVKSRFLQLPNRWSAAAVRRKMFSDSETMFESYNKKPCGREWRNTLF